MGLEVFKISRDANLQEFTASVIAPETGAYEYLSDTLGWSREKIFSTIRTWADMFWEEDVVYATALVYYKEVDYYILNKLAHLPEK